MFSWHFLIHFFFKMHFCLAHVSVEVKLTGIHVFVSSLHNGSVYTGHQPCSYNNAAQQSQDAAADPHHDVVEKEEVVEAVECFPESKKNGISSYCTEQIHYDSNIRHMGLKVFLSKMSNTIICLFCICII